MRGHSTGGLAVQHSGMHAAGVLTTHVDAGLVCVSVAVAIIGSYAALDLARRSSGASGVRKRLLVIGSGVTMGVGIWSMHFIGMLALRMNMPVAYNGLLVALSLIAAVGGSSVALAVVSRPDVSLRALLSATGFMGFAVAAMHYLGMASMQMAAIIHWNIWLVAGSIAIGLVASLIALALFARIGSRREGFGFTRRLGAAVLLGVGVAGLHYTAMAASTFAAVDGQTMTHRGLSTSALVSLLVLGAGIMLAVLIGGAAVDQRRAALAADLTIVANIARALGRVGDTRGRICQAIQDLTTADYVLLTQPDEHARPTVTTVLPADAGAALVDSAQGLYPHTPSRSGPQAAVAALPADGEMTPGLHQLSTGDTVLCEPLTLDSHSVGTLLIGWEGKVPRLSERTRTLVSMVAAEGAVAIDRENLLIRLDDLARRDELTGLFNRRVLTEQLDRELAAAHRHGRPLSLIMVDLDHFKRYNDTHGHQAGDQLLASVASAWTDQLRSTDIIARYGGEEFIIILPDCALDEAILTADHIREAVPAGATCSAGVATLERGDSAAQLIGRADHALYHAKASGRNCTSSALMTAHVAEASPRPA
jgi:diguanylate cyclase (GGDEF)-like protein